MRILILEDDALLAQAAEDALTEAGHDIVGLAADPETAVSLSRNRNLDLLLVDLQLRSGSTGAEAIDAIRQEVDAPALFVSGSHEACRKLGVAFATGCLKKPYSATDLVRAVAAAERLLNGDKPDDIPWNMELYSSGSLKL